jgi:hypothetical protein
MAGLHTAAGTWLKAAITIIGNVTIVVLLSLVTTHSAAGGDSTPVLGPSTLETPIMGENTTLSVASGSAPGSELPALRVVEDTKWGHHRLNSLTAAVPKGEVGFQATVKAGEASRLYLDIFDGAGQFVGAPQLDLARGSISVSGFSAKYLSISALPDGWYTFRVVVDVAGGKNARLSVGILDHSTNRRIEFDGDGKSDFLISSAEIVFGDRVYGEKQSRNVAK